MASALFRLVQACDPLDGVTFAFTIMPDHMHWLFQLGGRLSLGRLIARLKFESRDALRSFDLEWQRDFYEHRLRPEEKLEDYALYVFLNPYRAGLLRADEAWSWWWSRRPELFDFLAQLDAAGAPPPQWIDLPVPASVRHGE